VCDNSPLGKLTLWHHIIGLVGIFCGSPAGFASTGMTNIVLLTEMSTFFLNYREMQDNKASAETIHMVN